MEHCVSSSQQKGFIRKIRFSRKEGRRYLPRAHLSCLEHICSPTTALPHQPCSREWKHTWFAGKRSLFSVLSTTSKTIAWNSAPSTVRNETESATDLLNSAEISRGILIFWCLQNPMQHVSPETDFICVASQKMDIFDVKKAQRSCITENRIKYRKLR